MIDVRLGDFLVHDGTRYPVKAFEWWDMPGANDASFIKEATETYDIVRPTFTSGGHRQASDEAAAVLSSQAGLPLDSISSQLAQRAGLETPYTMRKTHFADATGYLVIIVEIPEG